MEDVGCRNDNDDDDNDNHGHDYYRDKVNKYQ